MRALRVPVALTGAVTACALLVPALPAAAADDLAGLRAQADRATAQLLEGTRRLERDQARLSEVQRRAASVRRQAGAAQAAVATSRRRLGVVVAAAYRQSAPDDLTLALSAGPDQLRDELVARADLEHVRGSEQDLLRRASGDSVRARALVRAAEQLAEEEAGRTRAVRREVARLQALATTSQRRLTAASGRLEARRRAAARAARADRAVLATCDGGATGGAPNGFLPGAALCPIGGGHALRADAAAAYLRMAAARELCVTDSYRSYAEQVSVYRRKPALAAVPGTSKHGLGIALDLGCGAQRFGSDTYRWLKANAPSYGWVHPDWAEPGGSMPEPWHWEYVG